jgi:hypothetical protein
MHEPTDRLWEEVEHARRMSGEQKLLAGARLFDLACRVMEDGIRGQHPELSNGEVMQAVRERLRLARELERTPMTAEAFLLRVVQTLNRSG